ncbi:hypothetical protein Tco_1157880 [Tanacetum coccineum]
MARSSTDLKMAKLKVGGGSEGLAGITLQLSSLSKEMKKLSKQQRLYPNRGRYRANAPGYYVEKDNKMGYQEKKLSLEDTLNKFMVESTKRDKENTDLIMEVQASTQATIKNHEASLKMMENHIFGLHDKELMKGAPIPKAMIKLYRPPIPSTSQLVERKSVDQDANKSRIKDEEKEKMNEWCLAWLDNTYPSKEINQGSFTLPCLIGSFSFSNASIDLGASEKFEEEVLEVEKSEMEDVSPKPTEYEESDEEWEGKSKHLIIDPFKYNEDIENEEILDKEIRQLELEYEIETLNKMRRKERVVNKCKDLVSVYESSSINDT